MRIEEDLRIPMPDGITLSARCWFPEGADPVPAILEMIPYRKRDVTAPRDATNHPHFCAAGYACIRVDLRGCGESDGLYDDEYSPQELGDICAVIAWLADQPWCSGKVGIMGISWGGFNGLQVAALRPRGLAAVITACSSVDRYADDIHYKGGCVLGENAGWASNVMARFALPPDPQLRPDWRQVWLDRLETTPFAVETWHRHRDRDAYWKHGSICEEFAAVQVPVLSLGGWHDGYRNTPGKLVAGLPGMCRTLVGPWNHKYPNLGVPGPRVDFVGEALRWWDRWLKDVQTGVEEDPPQRLWLMESVPPARVKVERPGRWVGLPADPGAHVTAREFDLTGTAMGTGAHGPSRTVQTHAACGAGTGEFFPFGFEAGDLPGDQSADDALSLCYDSAPLAERLEIVGGPVVTLRVAADQPRAQLAVRLCDLRPDGTSLMLAHGFLDLRYRAGFEAPQDVVPGQEMEITLRLDDIACALPAGHRLRLAISPTYWPFIWPERTPVALTVTGGTLSVPELTGPGLPVASMPPPRASETVQKVLRDGEASQMERHEDGQRVTRIVMDAGRTANIDHGLWHEDRLEETWRIGMDDPGAASVTFAWEKSVGRGDWQVTVTSETTMQTTAQGFALTGSLSAREGAQEVFHRTYAATVTR